MGSVAGSTGDQVYVGMEHRLSRGQTAIHANVETLDTGIHRHN
jgi:hypothetical protein